MWRIKTFAITVINRYICLTCEKIRLLLCVYYEIEEGTNQGYVKNKMEKDKFVGTVEEYYEKIEKERMIK